MSAAGPSHGADDRRAAARSSRPQEAGERRSPPGGPAPFLQERVRDAASAAGLGEAPANPLARMPDEQTLLRNLAIVDRATAGRGAKG